MADKQLETLAYRLQDLSSLRNLFSELNFDFADNPVNKDNWNDDQKKVVQEARIIASKDDYQIYYIQTNTDSLKEWKGISSKIIKDNHGLCMICSHNPSGFKWVFSSLSKEFSKSFSETRHVPIDIKPDIGVPKTFVDFLEKIKVGKDSTGTSIVSQISEAFDSFAVQIHDELTVNVFEALKVLSEGIISDKANNLTLDEQTLEEIRESVFILLYRIIFILYTEDRGIFPTEQKVYQEKFSFKWLKENWLLHSENQKKLSEFDVQERLWGFFRLIELGSEDLGYDSKEFFMRAYYGRLFDRKINSKLDKWKIQNNFLLDAISLLTRTHDKKGNYFFLDYSALETRHLGSIYEHLLEFHLTVKNKKIAELPNPEDRKSSGSYYTPKQLVNYIVRNSIEPLIKQIIKNNVEKQVQIEKILALKILDPSMGSGHFLVGAMEYLATRLCEIEFDEVTEQNYIERKREVVRKCIFGVDVNPLSVDLARLSLWLETLSSDKPLTFLSAHLKTGNSLVGTDFQSIFDKQTTLFESEKGSKMFKKNLKKFLMFEGLEDDSTSAVRMKLDEYYKLRSQGTIYYDLKFLLDCKTAEFFDIKIPNLGDFRAKIGENSMDFYLNENFEKIKQLSNAKKFFHWELEFPQIFYDESGEKNITKGFDVIIGNPPYRSYSENTSERIQTLLKKGYSIPKRITDLGYYQVDGHPLNERNPKMLQDDYVKFIRSAQWKIDSAGQGVIGYISNHSFLDNLTFKGMRQSLLNSFNRIYIINLHGDMRKKESSKSKIKDENVFKGIAQGVTIIILIKSNNFKDKKIFYNEVLGKRDLKFEWLENNPIDPLSKKLNDSNWTELIPKSPNYYFVPKDHSLESTYDKFWSVNDMFEIKSTTINTARDKLTIQSSPEEIKTTIEKFTKLDVDSISREFQVKNSVDWKIELAKKDLIESGLDNSKIIPILYRPFDTRYTYYTGKSGGFHGRPRYAVMQHMLQENLVLITRKVMQTPFNFTFIADKIFAHGVIASDSKGIEYAFPLYLHDTINNTKKSNLNPKIFFYLKKIYGKSVSSEQILNYIYAVLYSKNYREKFSTFLAESFPKIPFTKNIKTFEIMCNFGEELISLHTNKITFTPKTKFDISGINKVEKIKFENGKIFINDLQFFEFVSEDVWNFSIGSYRVLKKWLDSKKNKILKDEDINLFLQLPEILQRTMNIMNEIDKNNFYDVD